MKYIEFMGLPGSGKTSFADHIVTVLRSQRTTVFTRWDAKPKMMRRLIQEHPGIAWRILFLLTYVGQGPITRLLWGKYRYTFMLSFIHAYPQLVQQMVEYARTIRPVSGDPAESLSSEQLVTWFFDVACVYQSAQEVLGADDVLLLEEGLCQQTYYLIVAFREIGIDETKLETYLRLIPKPDVVVVLSTDPKKCEERMNIRTKGLANHLRKLSAPERIAILEQRLLTYTKAADYLETLGVTVIRVDTTDYNTGLHSFEEQFTGLWMLKNGT